MSIALPGLFSLISPCLAAETVLNPCPYLIKVLMNWYKDLWQDVTKILNTGWNVKKTGLFCADYSSLSEMITNDTSPEVKKWHIKFYKAIYKAL